MRVKRLTTGILIVAMLVSGVKITPALADTIGTLTNVPARGIRQSVLATDDRPEVESVASFGDADLASPGNLKGHTFSGADLEYQLEAEDEIIASSSNASLSGDGTRMELQQHGSVTYHLNQVMGFEPGRYLVSAHMNGNSQTIALSVDGQQKGTVTKAALGWGQEDLKTCYYHGIVELNENNRLTIAEAEGNYAHLDWIKLEKVDSVFWVEAENDGVAVLAGDAKLHGDGDRVEINGGGSISFDLSKIPGFVSGIYKLYAGANGARDSLGISVDGAKKGSIVTPGTSEWEKGTCMDCGFETELELNKDSILKLSDTNGSWGHVDYIRLVRTGDMAPKFDETDETTGIRIVAEQGVLPEGTRIVSDSIRHSDKKTIRELFREEDKKVFFYRFHLKDARGKEIDLDHLTGAGEVLAYLPIPSGYAGESELYYARDVDDNPAPLKGYETENGYLITQLDAYGVYMVVDENMWQLEGENFYHKTADGGNAADLQPFEEIRFVLPEDDSFERTTYNLIIRTCGYQSYRICVDGIERAMVMREGTEWSSYESCMVQTALTLSRGQVISVEADDKYGWIDYILLAPGEPFEGEDNGVTVQAEAGVVPFGAQMVAEPMDETELDEIRSWFGFTGEQVPLMNFYNISLLLGGEPVLPVGRLTIRIFVPEEYNRNELSVYRVEAGGRKIRVPFELSGDGETVEFETEYAGLYGIINQALGSGLYYTAAEYYDRTAGEGAFADLQPEDVIEFPVKNNPGFAEGNYLLYVRANGNRTKLLIKINGEPAGMLKRESTGFSETEDMTETGFGQVLHLNQEDVISIYAPGTEGLGPFGWIESIRLKETERKTPEKAAVKPRITLQAEDFYPEETEADGQAVNLNNPAKKLEIPVLERDGFEENDYLFTLYTTGTMRSWQVNVNGSAVLYGTRAGSGYGMEYMTKEIGSELIHLKPGDMLSVEFMEQDSDNYGNWIDRIVLNSNRRAPSADLVERTGGRIKKEEAENLLSPSQPGTSTEGRKLVYQGEAYYEKQKDNPAADLQPGEQLLVSVSDNDSFVDGSYRLMVRSCGNRELFRVKINGRNVGTISRKETGYGMDSMTEDVMGTAVNLVAGDTLVIEGQTGGKYGWVDWIRLTPAVRTEGKTNSSEGQKPYILEAENYYTKQKDNPAADLQPGEEVDILLDSDGGFTAGAYYIAVVSNGDRTVMGVKINERQVGSVTRNKTGFSMNSMTMDTLLRPVTLTSGDKVSICAPDEREKGAGPWGWVDRIILIPAQAANPQPREEYRYPAQAYGTGSFFLAAADLQPGESLVIPLSDHSEFMEGEYRVTVISNGTREQFQVMLNQDMAGSILREPSDFGDNGMSADELPGTLHLKPEDVITITGQAGDAFGWVSALVLEPVKQEGNG